MSKPLALLAALLLLASCSPVYETSYDYAAPATAEGRRCVEQCAAQRATCAQSCERSERMCLMDAESRAMRDYNMELDDSFRRRVGSSRTYFDYADRYRALCYTGSCRNSCDADYRGCFEACGGTVTATRVCTANCDR